MLPNVAPALDFFNVWTALSSLITAGALALLVYGAVLFGRRRTVRERLALVIAGGAVVTLTSQAGEPAPLRMLAQVGRLIARVLPGRFVKALNRATVQAGLTGRSSADALLGVRAVALLLGVEIAYTFSNSGHGTLGLFGAVLAAAVCLFAIDGYLRSRIQVRRRAADRDLPIILDLLTLSLAAGLGFDNALEMILIHFQGPLVDELTRYLSEIRSLGARRTEALRDVAMRLGDPPDLVDFVDAVNRAQTMGTGLLAAVEAQIVYLRQERHRRVASAAQRAPVRMLIPMTLFMLPVLMLIVLAPVGLRLANSLGGLH